MTEIQLIKEIRVRLGDVYDILEDASVDYNDELLFTHVVSANNALFATSVIDEYTITDLSISPVLSTLDGLLLATKTVAIFLGGNLSSMVRSGELGIRFKSGQDELSTIEAAKRIDAVVARAEKEFRIFVIAKIGGRSAGAERLQ